MASLDGLHPQLMRPRVEALLADPEAVARGVHVVSGFRSVERQRQLWEAAVRRYGSEAAASRWVARPGRSNHGPKVDGYGIAVDFGIRGVRSLRGQWPQDINDWFRRLAAKHGLFQRMAWEDWHFEPIANWQAAEQEEDFDMNAETEKRLRQIIREEVGSNGMRVVAAVSDDADKPLAPLRRRLGKDKSRPRWVWVLILQGVERIEGKLDKLLAK